MNWSMGRAVKAGVGVRDWFYSQMDPPPGIHFPGPRRDLGCLQGCGGHLLRLGGSCLPEAFIRDNATPTAISTVCCKEPCLGLPES